MRRVSCRVSYCTQRLSLSNSCAFRAPRGAVASWPTWTTLRGPWMPWNERVKSGQRAVKRLETIETLWGSARVPGPHTVLFGPADLSLYTSRNAPYWSWVNMSQSKQPQLTPCCTTRSPEPFGYSVPVHVAIRHNSSTSDSVHGCDRRRCGWTRSRRWRTSRPERAGRRRLRHCGRGCWTRARGRRQASAGRPRAASLCTRDESPSTARARRMYCRAPAPTRPRSWRRRACIGPIGVCTPLTSRTPRARLSRTARASPRSQSSSHLHFGTCNQSANS